MREKKNTPTQFIFEDGDTGRGEMLLHVKKTFDFVPSLRPKKDKVNKMGMLIPRFVPLQAADFLAYEMAKACGRGPRLTYTPTWAMEEFSRMPREPVEVSDAPTLKNYADIMKVWTTMENWPPKS